MIRILATEDEVATLEKFLRDNGVDPECTQSHPLCFFLARLITQIRIEFRGIFIRNTKLDRTSMGCKVQIS